MNELFKQWVVEVMNVTNKFLMQESLTPVVPAPVVPAPVVPAPVVPAPVVPAPVVPAPVVPAPVVPAGETDKRGVVWSTDHHAGTKSKKANGDWKAKKGGDKVALAEYEKQFIAPAAPMVPAPVVPAAITPSLFSELVQKITRITALPNPQIPANWVQEVLQKHGVNELPELHPDPAKTDLISKELDELCRMNNTQE